MNKNKPLLQSPKEDTAKKQVLIVTEATTRIKELILSNRFQGADKKEIEREISKIIIEASSKLDNPVLREQVKRSLQLNAQRYFYIADTKTKQIKQYVSKAFGNTYALPLGSDGSINLQSFDTSFRDKITLSKHAGTVLIKDYDKAVRAMVKQLANDTEQYVGPDKKKISLRNLAEMKTRYNATLKDLEKVKENAKNSKDAYADLVWTSSHSDCSIRCQPYQGKLYSISGKTGVINGIKYTPLDEALSGPKGDGNGIISGYNCRHTLNPYNGERQGPREYSDEEIKVDRKVNERQRFYERRIRSLKVEEKLLRRLETKDASERATYLRSKWQKYTNDYQRFSLEHGRKYELWRTKITEEEIIYPNKNILEKIDKHVKKEYNYNRDYKTIDNSNLDEFITKNNYTEEAIKKKLLKSEFDNLVAYTDKSIKTKTNYRTLNAKLNNDQELDIDEIKFMDHANRGIDLFPLKYDIKVYRGLALSDDVIDKLGILKEGNYAVNKGFMSTSIDKDVAEFYATENNDINKKKIVFEFDVIKGTKTINLDQITRTESDKENLFKTNTKYKILEVKKDYEGLDYYIKARIIKE